MLDPFINDDALTAQWPSGSAGNPAPRGQESQRHACKLDAIGGSAKVHDAVSLRKRAEWPWNRP